MNVTAWSTKDRDPIINPEMNFKTKTNSKHKVFGFSGKHENTPEMIRKNDGINPTVNFKELLNGGIEVPLPTPPGDGQDGVIPGEGIEIPGEGYDGVDAGGDDDLYTNPAGPGDTPVVNGP